MAKHLLSYYLIKFHPILTFVASDVWHIFMKIAYLKINSILGDASVYFWVICMVKGVGSFFYLDTHDFLCSRDVYFLENEFSFTARTLSTPSAASWLTFNFGKIGPSNATLTVVRESPVHCSTAHSPNGPLSIYGLKVSLHPLGSPLQSSPSLVIAAPLAPVAQEDPLDHFSSSAGPLGL